MKLSIQERVKFRPVICVAITYKAENEIISFYLLATHTHRRKNTLESVKLEQDCGNKGKTSKKKGKRKRKGVRRGLLKDREEECYRGVI